MRIHLPDIVPDARPVDALFLPLVVEALAEIENTFDPVDIARRTGAPELRIEVVHFVFEPQRLDALDDQGRVTDLTGANGLVVVQKEHRDAARSDHLIDHRPVAEPLHSAAGVLDAPEFPEAVGLVADHKIEAIGIIGSKFSYIGEGGEQVIDGQSLLRFGVVDLLHHLQRERLGPRLEHRLERLRTGGVHDLPMLTGGVGQELDGEDALPGSWSATDDEHLLLSMGLRHLNRVTDGEVRGFLLVEEPPVLLSLDALDHSIKELRARKRGSLANSIGDGFARPGDEPMSQPLRKRPGLVGVEERVLLL